MLSKVNKTKGQFNRRFRQIRKLWSTEGCVKLLDRGRRLASERLAPKNVVLPVWRCDVMAANLVKPFCPVIPEIVPGQPLVANWITTPPSPGSGGHTTLFRIIRYLESHGYRNRVYFYDVYMGDHQYYESITRDYYGFEGPIANVSDGMEDAHIVTATAWPTSYPVFNSSCDGKRFYFVQDYEPYFHPTGAISLLAENTYRMGFHAITAGDWLAAKLRNEFNMRADSFDFGCDTSSYYREESSKLTGLVFYARPEAARRGFELGLMAMEIFAARHPEVDLHFYGEKMGSLPFKFIDHGRITPAELNKIYNKCYAGLSLSLSNVSLVPHEMLAAGCIPIVNEAVQNRLVLANPYVRYAEPYPHALASALEEVVRMPNCDALSRSAALSVHGSTWDDAGATVDRIIRKALKYDPQAANRDNGELSITEV